MRTLQSRLCVPVLACLLLLGGACASTPRHQATVASGTLYEALGAIQDTEATLHQGGQISDTQHLQFEVYLLKALQAGRAFNTLVSQWPVGTPAPKALQGYVNDLLGALQAALAQVPLSNTQTQLVNQVLAVSRLVTTILLAHQ